MFIKVSKYTTYIQSNLASVMYTVGTFSVFNLMDKSHIVHFLNPVYSFCPARFQSDTILTRKRSQCKCNKISKEVYQDLPDLTYKNLLGSELLWRCTPSV